MARPPRVPDRPAGPAAPPTKATVHDLAPRLSFPLSKDSTRIAYDKLQEKTKNQLRRVLADPDLAAQLGVPVAPLGAGPGVQGAPGGEAFPPSLAAVALDACGMLLVALAKHRQIAHADHLAFKPDQTALLAPKAAVLIDKWAPNSLGTYHLEAEFGIALLGVVMANVAAMRAASGLPAAPVAPAAASGPVLVETPEKPNSSDNFRSVNL